MALEIVIEIVDISAPTTVSTGRKPYDVVEVAYKKDGKVEGKKLLSFNNPGVFKGIQRFKRGDMVEVSIEKDANGYWQWKTIKEAGQAASTDSVPVETTSAKPAQVNRSYNNYETPEERAQKQVYIVKQSSLSAALNYFELVKGKPSPDEVISLADKFKEYVFSKGTPVEQIVAMDDDIPL